MSFFPQRAGFAIEYARRPYSDGRMPHHLPVACALTAIYMGNFPGYIWSVFQIHHGGDDVLDLSNSPERNLRFESGVRFLRMRPDDGG